MPKPGAQPAVPSSHGMMTNCKVVVVGDGAVGKSCLLLRFADDTYTESYISTIGVDFKIRTIQLDGKTIKLQIWDTAGQERFKSLAPSYMRNSKVVVIVANMNDEDSAEKTRKWIRLAEESTVEGTPFVICGTKSDLEHKANIHAHMFPMHTFAVTSAQTGKGVENLFVAIAALSVERVPEPVVNEPMDLVLEYNKVEETTKDGCCFS